MQEQENIKEIKISTVINTAREAIADLQVLCQKGLQNNSLYKRAFIRRMCDLGEALTYFRKYTDSANPLLVSNPMLSEIQDNDDILVTGFTRARNKLMHDYPIEHRAGDESNFNNALKHFQDNENLLSQALNQISNKPQVTEGELCYKKINTPPDDTTNNNMLNYMEYTNLEITEMLETLNSNGLVKIINPGDKNETYIFNESEFNQKEDKKYISYGIENYIENICNGIKSYEKHKNYEFHNDGEDEILIKIYNTLSIDEQNIYATLDSIRENIGHGIERTFISGDYKDFIETIPFIQKKYIKPVMEYLPNKFYNNFISFIDSEEDINLNLRYLSTCDDMKSLSAQEFEEKLKTIRLAIMNAYARAHINREYIEKLKDNNGKIIYYNEDTLTNENLNWFYYNIPTLEFYPFEYLFLFEEFDYYRSRKDKAFSLFSNIDALKDRLKAEILPYNKIEELEKIILELKDELLACGTKPDFVALTTKEETDAIYNIFKNTDEAIIIFIPNKNYINIKCYYIDEDQKSGYFTLLNYAVIHRKKDIVEFLLSKGADPFETDSEGKSALYYAKEYQYSEIENILYKNMCDSPFSTNDLNYFKKQIEEISTAFSEKRKITENAQKSLINYENITPNTNKRNPDEDTDDHIHKQKKIDNLTNVPSTETEKRPFSNI